MLRPFPFFLTAAIVGAVLSAGAFAGAVAVSSTAPPTTSAPAPPPLVRAPDATATTGSTPLPSEAVIRKAMNSLVAGVKLQSIRTTPISGLLEVELAGTGEVLYVTSDGKYLVSGNLIEIASRRDLTEASRAVSRRALLKDITPQQMIVFAPSHPKYTVTVFTDVDCGYCRKLHSQIADYNKAGIAVDYLFFPRDGIGSESFDKAVSVWCASDRQKAFTDAKKGLTVAKAKCTNPVTMDYNLGEKVGVDGTPAIFTADGTQIGGYLSPTEMRIKLEKMAAQPSS